MKNFYRFTPQAGLFAFLLFIFSNAFAQTSPTISYQGVLDNNGAAVNGMDTLKISIYTSETGGNPLYTETQRADVTNGIFNISIGSVTPLLPTLDFTKQYYLAISVNGGPELSPRSVMSFAPYAIRALNADTASYARTSNGLSGNYVSSIDGLWGAVSLVGANGITISGSPPIITIGYSGVESLNGSEGILTLAGGGGTSISRSGSTITITSNGTGAPGIATIQNLDATLNIKNPSGPIDTIGLAQQNALMNQVLAWNGSAWRPYTLPNQYQPDSIKDLGDARVYSPPRLDLYLGDGSGTQDSSGASNTAIGFFAMYSNKSGQANTAIGGSALYSNTSGASNAATGFQALYSNTTGFDNTATGFQSLYSNITGSNNEGTGYQSLYSNTTGTNNSAFGYQSMYKNTTGSGNSAFGPATLDSNTTGMGNTAVGGNALTSNTSGWSNVAVGNNALHNSAAIPNQVAIGDSALFANGQSATTLDSSTGNTAIGSKALRSNTKGAYNTATGFQALFNNTTGYHNTANGYQALFNNTNNLAFANTAVGFQALYSNTSGSQNTAVGRQVLYSNTGSENTAVGDIALHNNTTGSTNSAFGELAMNSNTTGYENTACGGSALGFNSTGWDNTAVGVLALNNNFTGFDNVAVGWGALHFTGNRSYLVAIGDSALYNNGLEPGGANPTLDSASVNVAVGFQALTTNTNGSYNTAVGYQALYANLSGYHNTAFGYLALNGNSTGNNNVAIGDNTGPTSSALSNTICLGSNAQASVSNEVVIGNPNVTSLYCYGAYAATTANSANLYVGSNGQIMRSTSSARYKTNIHDLDINTDKLYDLRPVSYTSKIDGKEYFGLVAEDVAKVLPDLAEYARAKDVIPGSTSEEMIPDAVKYPMLSVLLLDELKKEHARAESQEKQMESQAKIIADLERRMEAVENSQKAAR